jgi:hypothetical protein
MTPGITILFFIAVVAHSQRRPATFANVKMTARSRMMIPMSASLIAMAVLYPYHLSIIMNLVDGSVNHRELIIIGIYNSDQILR